MGRNEIKSIEIFFNFGLDMVKEISNKNMHDSPVKFKTARAGGAEKTNQC